MAFRFYSVPTLGCLLILFTLASAPAADFSSFVASLWPDARAAGVQSRTFEKAMSGLSVDPKIAPLIARQPEFTTPIGAYLNKRVSVASVRIGTRKLNEWRSLLRELSSRYGVDPDIIVAIWGLETNYGGFTGGRHVLRYRRACSL